MSKKRSASSAAVDSSSAIEPQAKSTAVAPSSNHPVRIYWVVAHTKEMKGSIEYFKKHFGFDEGHIEV